VSSSNGRDSGSIASVNIAERTVAGERRVVDLPDGSRATLGAQSELRVLRGFGDKDRDVFLKGEAIFTVRHDATRPFRVHAGDAVAEDIGTSFSVRSYEDDHSVRVVVAEGAVSLRRARSESASAVTLRARDVARLTPTGEPVVLHEQPVERILSWANGELVFDDARLGDIVAELERWYGVKITLADPQLAQRHYSATFRGDSLESVLQVISIGLDLQAEREGDKVTLRAGRRAPAPRRSALTSHRVEVGV
jgi:transmembrane sensor